jgi:hypothetical protein
VSARTAAAVLRKLARWLAGGFPHDTPADGTAVAGGGTAPEQSPFRSLDERRDT